MCPDSWCALASSGRVQGVRLACGVLTGSTCWPGQKGVYKDPWFQCRGANARGVRFRLAGSLSFWSVATSMVSQEVAVGGLFPSVNLFSLTWSDSWFVRLGAGLVVV